MKKRQKLYIAISNFSNQEVKNITLSLLKKKKLQYAITKNFLA